ncbi:hypothetical protein WJX81_001820 [Elliptochloris bilobata]|uniref:Minichromosome loss protein Mcl1 middle region domain-containing protein n=1 Tax=Elliptochloris bilobata TaxID=381761 RepID=A0AAW1RVE5_9CHLO
MDTLTYVVQEPVHQVTLSIPLHCLAVNPAGTQVAVADDINYVKFYKLPDLEKGDVATRFTLPVRAVSFSPDGTKLVAAGDDAGIKLVNVADTKVLRTFKAGPYTRSLAYDPEGEYVASVAADGSLQVWHVAGKAELRLPRAAPKVDAASAARSLLAWHPDGSLLAVPGCDNDVTVYERLSWEPAYSLAGPHSARVNAVCFSPDGLYVVTAGQDRLLVVWDVAEKSVVATRTTPDPVSDMAWQPEGTALLCITESCGVVLWTDVLPESRQQPSPSAGRHRLRSEDGSASSLLDGSKGTDLADFIDRDIPEPSKPAAQVPAGRPQLDGQRWPSPQGPIQSGSTPAGDTRRRWLAFSLLGCISSRMEEGQSVVEVAFHDAASHKRVPLFSDFRDFCMASLGPKGALYASAAAVGTPSMLMYRPFQSWAAGGEWCFTLPAAVSAVCVAAGGSFCAVTTSDRLLRVFALSGVQMSVISLPGAPVALAVQGNVLAAVWHAGLPAGDGSQALEYTLYEFAPLTQAASGRVPLGTGAALAWLGFGEAGELAAYDTAAVLRMRSGDAGNLWVPVFDGAACGKPGEVYWPVGVAGGELVCVSCSDAVQHPRVIPRPALSRLALRVPALSAGDDAVANLEAELLRRNVTLSHLRELVGGNGDPAIDARLASEEAEADRTLLRLFQAALKGEKLARALDLATCVALPQSLEGALRLARHHRALALVERLQLLQQHSHAGVEDDDPADVVPMDAGEPSIPSTERATPPAGTQPLSTATRSPVRAHTPAALLPSIKANLFDARGVRADEPACKRKAPAANPFARKPKAPKM